MSVLKQFLSLMMMMGILLIGGATAYAQGGVAPSGQVGIGLSTAGPAIGYAINPSIQIAFQLQVSLQTTGDTSFTEYFMGPSVRFLLEGTVNPFFNAGLLIGKQAGTDKTSIQLIGGFGLAGYISRNLGASASFSIINLAVSPEPSTTTFGIFSPVVGVEWWFNR